MTELSPMASKMVEIIKSRPGASFAELNRLLTDAGYPVRGNWALEPVPNMVMWPGLSEEFCDVVNEVKHSKLAHLHVLMSDLEAFLVHSFDGEMPALPIAKRPPAGGYKEPHWTPVVWHPGPGCAAKNCVPGKPRRSAAKTGA